MEKEKRLNREKKRECIDIRYKIGTTNGENPKVIYVDGCTFIVPSENKENYSEDVKSVKFQISKKINSFLLNNIYFDKKFIFFIDVSENFLEYGKKSFFNFQIYFKQKNTDSFKKIVSNIDCDINALISDIHISLLKSGFVTAKKK